jgi:bacteriocin-like protein
MENTELTFEELEQVVGGTETDCCEENFSPACECGG